MPTITAIKPQKRKNSPSRKASAGRGRVNIYLDGEFGFGLDLENFVKLGLKVEQQLSEEKIIEITKKAEFQKALDRLLMFATLRPRSEKEVRDWMARKKIGDSFKNALFEKLHKLELLDDEKFAKWWVEQRLAFKSKSLRDLSYELRSKGINKDIINNVLTEVNIDEEKVAKDLLEKKMYRWRSLGKPDKKRKMSEYLARKGFGWSVIGKVTSDG